MVSLACMKELLHHQINNSMSIYKALMYFALFIGSLTSLLLVVNKIIHKYDLITWSDGVRW